MIGDGKQVFRSISASTKGEKFRMTQDYLRRSRGIEIIVNYLSFLTYYLETSRSIFLHS